MTLIYIPGCFDMLHDDHREFIDRCITTIIRGRRISAIAIGLATDAEVQRSKGPGRPLLGFERRRQDILSCFAQQGIVGSFEVFPLSREEVPWSQGLSPSTTIIAVKASNYSEDWLTVEADRRGYEIFYIDEGDRFHTSDVLVQLAACRQRTIGYDGCADRRMPSASGHSRCRIYKAEPHSCNRCGKWRGRWGGHPYHRTGRFAPTATWSALGLPPVTIVSRRVA